MRFKHLIMILAVVGIHTGLACDAEAGQTICLKTTANEAADIAGFDKLVRTEIARHPSYTVVGKECDVTLNAELVRLDTLTYLTVRLDQQVPVRYEIKDKATLLETLETAISLVLDNDPERLMADVSNYNRSRRLSHSILVAGHNYWGFETFESMMRTGRRTQSFVPGIAATARRGSDYWSVAVRLHLQGWLKDPTPAAPVLKVDAGLDAALNYEFLNRANTSPYVGLGFGIQYFRLEGVIEETGVYESNDEVMPVVLGRLGVRLLRLYDVNVDIFATAFLPCMTTGGGGVLFDHREYTPIIQMGAGVGF
jgi:hypothetical protein